MKKLFKNILASALPQIASLISGLILPSLIIRNFGSEINGLVSSTKTISSYISIVGAGIATAVTQALYVPVAKKDVVSINGMLHAANTMFQRIGIVYCAILLIISSIYPLIIHTSLRNSSVFLLLIVIGISGASEFFAIGRCRALLYADQKTYVCTLIQAIGILCSVLFAAVTLWLNASIVLVQLSISITYILRSIILILYVNKHYPLLRDFKTAPPIETAVEKRKDAMVHQLSGLAALNSQTTILSVITGLESVSIYSVYNNVFSAIQSICTSLCTAVTPFIGRELALNKRDSLLKMYDIMEFSFFNLVAFVYSVSAVMILPFIRIYTSHADINYIYPYFAVIFVFFSAFYVLKLPCCALINISGQFKETKWKAILEAILSIVLGVACTYYIGFSGVILGASIALAWRCFDTIIYTNKHVLLCSNKKSLFRLLRVILLISISAFLQTQVALQIDSYFDWVKYACCVSALCMLILLANAFIFDRSTIQNLKAFFKKLK